MALKIFGIDEGTARATASAMFRYSAGTFRHTATTTAPAWDGTAEATALATTAAWRGCAWAAVPATTAAKSGAACAAAPAIAAAPAGLSRMAFLTTRMVLASRSDAFDDLITSATFAGNSARGTPDSTSPENLAEPRSPAEAMERIKQTPSPIIPFMNREYELGAVE